MVTGPRQSTGIELFDVKNSYYIGNYQQCINEAQKLKPTSPEVQLERDIFLFRAYIAQKKFRIVFDEINSSSPAELRPLRLLAEYLSGSGNENRIVTSLDEQIEKNPSLVANQVAATIYYHEGNFESALRALHQDDNLESSAINVAVYLGMDRVDLARKELKTMQEKDEDATVTQLSQAWINIAMGGEKLQDAFYIFQELIDKYGATNQLLNGQATCNMGMGRYEEAETILQDAMERDINDPDTCINFVVMSEHFGKRTEANRTFSQLKDSSIKHRYVKDILNKEAEFDRLQAQYTAEVPAQ